MNRMFLIIIVITNGKIIYNSFLLLIITLINRF